MVLPKSRPDALSALPGTWPTLARTAARTSLAPAMPFAAEEERLLSGITVSAEVAEFDERRAAVTQKLVLDRQAIAGTGGLMVGEVLEGTR